MKHFLLFLFISMHLLPMNAQVTEKYCGFEMKDALSENVIEALSSMGNGKDLGILSVPIALTFLMKSDSTSSYYEGLEQSIMDSITAHFLPVGIYFYLAESPVFIYEDSVYEFVVGEHEEFLYPGINQNRLNVVIANSVSQGVGGGVCGLAKVYPNTVLVRYSCIPTNTISHEIGHEFGLPHTHETRWGVELVNGSNCSTTGDLICDTPSDPNRADLVSNECEWEGTYEDENGYDVYLVDANGDKYSPDVSNLMSYYWFLGCRNDFTYQQSVIMHKNIAQKLPYYGYESPKMMFVVDDRNDMCEEGYSISARVENPDSNVVYHWDFDNDGETDRTGIDADFLYKEYGDYSIQLTMIYPDGREFYYSKPCIIKYQNEPIVAPFLDVYDVVIERNHVILVEESFYKWNLKLRLAEGRVVAGDQIHINENSVMEYKVDISHLEQAVLKFEYYCNTDAIMGGDSLLIELITCKDEPIVLFEKWGKSLGTDGQYLPISIPLPTVDSEIVRLRFTTKGDAKNWHDIYIDNLEVAKEFTSNSNTTESNKLSVYPNPTQAFIQIKSDQHISKVQLIDIYGKTFDTYTQFDKINLSHLPNGMYIVKTWFDGKYIANRILKLN